MLGVRVGVGEEEQGGLALVTDRPREKMQDVSCPAPTTPQAPTQLDPHYCLGWWFSTRGEFNSSSPGVFSTLKDIFCCHSWEVENRSHLMERCPRWLSDKESACNARDTAEATGSIPGWRRAPGEGNGNPLEYSCLGNPMDRGAWRAVVHRVAKEFVGTQLSN